MPSGSRAATEYTFWPLVAAVAWQGYAQKGRGALLVDLCGFRSCFDMDNRGLSLLYFTGEELADMSAQLIEAVQNYRPERDAA